MPEEKILEDITFKYSGLMEFSQVYKRVYDYLDSKGFDITIKKHEEKVKDDGSKEVSVEIESEKEVTDYVKYKISVELKAENLRKVIVKAGGAQRELESGDLELKVNASMETDYKKMFGDDIKKWILRSLLEKHIWKPELKEHKSNIKNIGYGLIKEVEDIVNAYKIFE